jgi:hypothetical protein
VGHRVEAMSKSNGRDEEGENETFSFRLTAQVGGLGSRHPWNWP